MYSSQSEERTGTLLKIFTAMAILGWPAWGFSGSAPGIVALMCREFLVLIGMANLIAWPVAYFAVKDCLNNFAYRTQIPAVFFIGALITSLAIGLMTMIYKAMRAASANPVDALKHE